jgi:ferredoxin
MLRRVRLAVAAVLFLCENLFFIGVAGGTGVFERFQFVPALLAMNFAAIAFIVALTLLLGRVYCSTLCPLGVFQDIVIGIARVFAKKRFVYAPPHTLFRYAALSVVAVAFAVGIAAVPALIDPYSLYGRMATHLLQPVAYAANNAIAWMADSLGHPFVFKEEIFVRSTLATSVAITSLVAIVVVAARWGRLYCNTLCPAGSLLAFLSQRPLFKVVIDGTSCVECGVCAKACKSGCIDAKSRTVDFGRCVCCFDCLTACRKNAIHYTMTATKTVDASVPAVVLEHAKGRKWVGRREFVTTAAVSVATVVAATVRKESSLAAAVPEPVSPPGSGGRSRLLSQCTSCNLCVAKCKGNVIRPSLLEYGVSGIMMPKLDFSRGFCDWDCNECGQACPNGAIAPLTIDDKRKTKIGQAVYVRDRCVLVTDQVDSCGNCAKHCPTNAITLVEEKDKKKYPSIDEDKCIGCGACEYHCPSKPLAIHVVGLSHRSV